VEAAKKEESRRAALHQPGRLREGAGERAFLVMSSSSFRCANKLTTEMSPQDSPSAVQNSTFG
jgi:hypothetical protein